MSSDAWNESRAAAGADELEPQLAALLERIEVLGYDVAVEEFRSRRPVDEARLLQRLQALRDLRLLGHALPDRIDRFPVIRRLGGGGMGVVYLVRDEAMQRDVALKTLPPHLCRSGAARQRFEREVRAIGQLHHPGIIGAFTVGEADGVPFFTMEYVSGRTLAHVLQELRQRVHARARRITLTAADLWTAAGVDGPVGDPDYLHAACALIAKVAEALSAAHELGILHRDVKPSNIFVGSDGAPRLFDFGLAHRDDGADLTLTGELLGTVHYVSPEQATGVAAIDARADVYSLGATLYELLTLETPFRGTTTEAILHAIAERDPVPPHQLNAHVDPDLSTICLTALAKKPSQRYESARAFAEDLQRRLLRQPVHARPVGALTRTLRRLRRNRALAAAVILGIVMVLGVPAGLLIANAELRERAAHATAIAATFEDVLLAADIEELGKDAKAVDLLRVAAEKAGERLADYPADEGRVLMRIGSLLLGFDLPAEAEAHLRRALDRLVAAHGPVHADIAATLNHLGNVHRLSGRIDDAERSYRQAATTALALADPEAATYLSNLGRLLAFAGRNAEASAAFVEAMQVLDASAEGDSSTRLGIWLGMSDVAAAAGRLDESERNVQDAIAWLGRHPPVEMAQLVFEAAGILAQRRDDRPRVREMFTRQVEAASAVFPEASTHVATAYKNLGDADWAVDDVGAAVEHYRRAADLLARARPDVPESAQLGMFRACLGIALATLRHADAEHTLVDAARVLDLNPDDYTAVRACVDLELAFVRLDTMGPNPALGAAFAAAEAAIRPEYWQGQLGRARARRGRAIVEWHCGDRERGGELYRETIELLESIQPRPALLATALVEYAEVQERSGQLAPALTTLGRALDLLSGGGHEPVATARAHLGCARVQYRQGLLEDAGSTLARCLTPEVAAELASDPRRDPAECEALRSADPVAGTLAAWACAMR